MTPRVSILVPLYNVARWLPTFIASISRHRLGDVAEYVFVDDCSIDDTLNVLARELEMFGLREQSKILRHETNRGVCIVRQTLLDAAGGEYVIFADPDDRIDAGMYRQLVEFAERERADFVWEDFYESDCRRSQACSTDPRLLIGALLTGRLHGATWNKLIRRDFITRHNCRFIDDRIGLCEDLCFLVDLFSQNPTCAYSPTCHYHYIPVQGSATHGLSEDRFDDLKKVEQHLRNVLDSAEYAGILSQWAYGNNLACYLSDSVSNEYFRGFINGSFWLRGLKTNVVLKMLYFLAALGCRSFSKLLYRAISDRRQSCNM